MHEGGDDMIDPGNGGNTREDVSDANRGTVETDRNDGGRGEMGGHTNPTEPQGSGSTSDIGKKRPPRKRAKGEKPQRRRQDDGKQHDRAGPARQEGPALPSGEREHEPDRARAI